MSELLRDKVVLITGATGALGSVVAHVFAETGARLALTSTSADDLEALAERLPLAAEDVFTITADATDEEEVRTMVEAVAEHFGALHVLLNTVGMWRGGAPVQDVAVGTWDRTLDVNLRSAFLLSKGALPHLLEQDWGRIVHVGSKTAVQPRGKRAAYAVSKTGVIALTEVIADEVKGSGVTANVILPSVIDTPANREMFPDPDVDAWVPPERIAQLMKFLCTDAGASINGARLPIYGDV